MGAAVGGIVGAGVGADVAKRLGWQMLYKWF